VKLWAATLGCVGFVLRTSALAQDKNLLLMPESHHLASGGKLPIW